MKSIKGLLLILAVAGLSAPVFADSTVLERSQRGGFKIGINALYLCPTNSDLDFTTKSPNILTSSMEQQNFAAETSYNRGVYGQMGYLFPYTSNDLTLGYTYLHSNESTFVAAPPVSPSSPIEDFVLYSPPTNINAIATQYPHSGVSLYRIGSTRGTVEFNLNTVDLEVGQRFISGDYSMRIFSGLRYANVDYTLNTLLYPNLDILSPNQSYPTSDQAFTSQFRGIGPRIGVDGRYSLGSGFGLDANISTALLVGYLDSDFKLNATANVINGRISLPINSHSKVISDTQTRAVPGLEGKLGIDYVYSIGSGANESVLMFEAGYQATHYFNAVDRTRIVPFFMPEAGVKYYSSQISISDVGFDGIYLGVKYYV